MKRNMGKADRMIRFIIAIVIILAGLYFQSWWGLIALLPLATSYTGFCPLYKLLGISTCKTEPI
jgi:hypothetical protein